MKKLLIAIVAAAPASGAFTRAFLDIPEGHRADGAGKRSSELDGAVEYAYGTFRCSEAFTHYRPRWP